MIGLQTTAAQYVVEEMGNMAILQLQSANPQFSFLIKKNPDSGMILRTIRKGTAFGWYSDNHTFNIYFKDAENEVSYKQSEDDNFEYLNVSRYNTPLFPLNALNEFFSATLRAQDERDEEGYEHSLFINMIHIERSHYIQFFSNHLHDFSFEIQQLAHKSYSLTVKTQKSLYQLLHVTSVLCVFLAIIGNERFHISDSLLEKYIKSLQVMEAPFYIRSLFSRNFLLTRELYHRYKRSLEQSTREVIRFEFGSTAQQRRAFIENILPFDKSILDVGCGEGFYAIPFAGKLEASYYAIDINEEVVQAVKRKAEKKELENVIPMLSIDQFLKEYNGELVDVILTEVIEHMSLEEAAKLIRQICQEVRFEYFVITTPNADFNRFYALNTYRHDDHKWEMGEAAFRQWLNDVTSDIQVHCEFIGIGDCVNDIQTTQGAILKKRGE